jgi:VanZ family protein
MLRRAWLALGWIWVAVVFYLSLMPHPPEPVAFPGADKVEHALAYAALMLWFCQVHVGTGARIGTSLWLVAMGVGIEFLQGMTGYRAFEYADMLADATGVLAGWALAQTKLGYVLRMLEHGKQ